MIRNNSTVMLCMSKIVSKIAHQPFSLPDHNWIHIYDKKQILLVLVFIILKRL